MRTRTLSPRGHPPPINETSLESRKWRLEVEKKINWNEQMGQGRLETPTSEEREREGHIIVDR